MSKPSYRVRSISRPHANRFAKLRACKCFAELHERITDGWPLSQVARFIQEDRKEYVDVGRASLVSVLHEYRQTLPIGPMVKAQGSPAVFSALVERAVDGLDELEELEKLYRIQIERVGIGHGKEKTVGLLFPTMTQEIKEAARILEARAQLKMDLGLTDRHLGTAEVAVNVAADIAQKYGGNEKVRKVLEDDGSRRKVLGIAERFLALAGTKRAGALAATEPEPPEPDPEKTDPGPAEPEPVFPEESEEEPELPPEFEKDPDQLPDEAA